MRLGILVPYRDRQKHLAQFIPHYSRRMKTAKIIVCEQYGNEPFNRAKLLNISFVEFQNEFDYFAAHDVDMLCTKGNYDYCENPTQLATHAQQFKYKMPFHEYFGGATLFNNKDFILCNGYSNYFEGYGGEDNEMYHNVLNSGLTISYRDCWYQSLYHPPSHPTGYDAAKMEQAKQPRKENDGLSGCEYRIIDRIEFPLYTKLIVEL